MGLYKDSAISSWFCVLLLLVQLVRCFGRFLLPCARRFCFLKLVWVPGQWSDQFVNLACTWGRGWEEGVVFLYFFLCIFGLGTSHSVLCCQPASVSGVWLLCGGVWCRSTWSCCGKWLRLPRELSLLAISCSWVLNIVSPMWNLYNSRWQISTHTHLLCMHTHTPTLNVCACACGVHAHALTWSCTVTLMHPYK